MNDINGWMISIGYINGLTGGYYPPLRAQLNKLFVLRCNSIRISWKWNRFTNMMQPTEPSDQSF